MWKTSTNVQYPRTVVFIFCSLGLMAAHIRPKRFFQGGHFGSYNSGQQGETSNLIPHTTTTTTTTTTTSTSTSTSTTTTTTTSSTTTTTTDPKFNFFKKNYRPTDMTTYTSRQVAAKKETVFNYTKLNILSTKKLKNQ